MEYRNLSHEYDDLWDDLVSPNGGFILTLGEGDDDDGNSKTVHKNGISMFHQLHCLTLLRGAIQRMVDQNHTMSGQQQHGGGNQHSSEHWSQDHYLHCFDYLRQVCPFLLFRNLYGENVRR